MCYCSVWILSLTHAILCDFLDLESYGDVILHMSMTRLIATQKRSLWSHLYLDRVISDMEHLQEESMRYISCRALLHAYGMRSLSAGTDGNPLDMDSNDDDVNIDRSNTNANSNSGIGASSTLL
jgi:hypothetical protein